MKKLFLAAAFILCAAGSFSQTLTLNEAFRLARQNYPLIQKKELLQQSVKYSLSNASKAFLPQLSVSGQATYQSEATKIPISLPGIKALSKDQYRIQGEVSQLIYDGGVIQNQKELLKADEAIQQQDIEVSLHTLKERIAQIYFSILLFDAQLKQRDIFRQNLSGALKKAEENLSQGTTFKSSVNELKAEIINADMTETEIRSDRNGYIDMLALLIGKPLGNDTEFLTPLPPPLPAAIVRPELKLFELQKNTINIQEQKLQTDLLPRISAFVQGGYGRPGLNMLNNNFEPFALGGIRLSFSLGGLYTQKNNKTLLNLKRKQIEADQETFLLNTKASLEKEKADISKYRGLLTQDDEVIALREEITQSAKAQLANGVITTNEYINKLNAENLARQIKNLHLVQLLKAQTNYQSIAGY